MTVGTTFYGVFECAHDFRRLAAVRHRLDGNGCSEEANRRRSRPGGSAARDVSAFGDLLRATMPRRQLQRRHPACATAETTPAKLPPTQRMRRRATLTIKTKRFGLICSDILVLETIVWRISVYVERKSSALIGNRRTGFPVRAKIALATAGATGGTPGSPTPVELFRCSPRCTLRFEVTRTCAASGNCGNCFAGPDHFAE